MYCFGILVVWGGGAVYEAVKFLRRGFRHPPL